MEKWFFIVESNCVDPSKEVEYNQWYDEIDLPDVLETKGFTKVTRYACETDLDQRYHRIDPLEGRGKYMALYEIETDDIDGVMRALEEGVKKMNDRGRLTNLISVTSRRLYREIASLSN